MFNSTFPPHILTVLGLARPLADTGYQEMEYNSALDSSTKGRQGISIKRLFLSGYAASRLTEF
jgi:hypothetical protein